MGIQGKVEKSPLTVEACNTCDRTFQTCMSWDHTIDAIALRIRQAVELPAILQATVDEVQRLLGCDRVFIYRFEPDLQGRVVTEALSAPHWSVMDLAVHDPCFESSWLDPKPEKRYFAIEDIATADLTPCHGNFLASFQVKANLVIPILEADTPWGLLIAHHCQRARSWQPVEIEGLQVLAVQVGIAIHQAALIEQLQVAKAELEAQVTARTRELEQTNTQLQRLATIVESSQDAIISKTPDGIITSWNRAAETLFGYTATEIIGQPITTIIPADHQAEAQQILDRIHQGQRVDTYETQRRRKDGQLIDVAITVSPIRDPNGHIVGASKIARDISDRKAAATTLQESEARFRYLADHAPVLIWLAGQDKLCFHFNKVWLDFTGRTMAQEMGKGWTESIHPDDFQFCLETYTQAFNARQPFEMEYRLRRFDGEYRWLLDTGTPRFDQAGQFLGYIGSCLDISDRKQTATQLKDLSRRLELAVRSAQIGIWDWDINQNILVWDERMYELYGLTQPAEAPLVYDIWANGLHPDDREPTERLLQQAVVGQATYDTVFRVIHPNQSIHTIQAHGILMRDAQGNPKNMIGVNFDITDRQQAELELKSTKEQLELVLQASSEGFWDWDLLADQIYFSPRWKEMLGYTDHELENSFDMWESVIFEEDQIAALQLIEDYNSGKIDNFVAIQRFHHKTGTTVHVLARAIHLKNAQGQVTRMVGSHLDITNMTHIQAALKNSEMQLSGILNSALDGIMAFRAIRDDQGHIIDFEWLLSNPTACQAVNHSVEDLIGQRLLSVLPGNRTDGLFDLYTKVVETGDPIQRQFHYNHDGIDTWFENIAVKLGDGFTVTFRDISDIKASEQALQTANQTLERHVQDLRQRNEEMLLLSETSDFLQACRTIEEACSVITTLVKPLFPNCSGSFHVTGASRNRVEAVAQWGNTLYSAPDFQPHDCWGLRRGRWHQVSPDRSGLRCNHIVSDDPNLATLCIPMIAQGETLGMFHLSTDNAAALDGSKRQLARTVAEQVGLAIANLNLRETLQTQSIRDALTGLFNRRYLEEALQKEIARARRHQSSVAIVMMDVDHFKSFNDTYGHDAGDFVLKSLGQLLRDKVRASDTACRYGGEEITLVFPETPLHEALGLAEQIRQAIANLTLTYGNQQLHSITASFGVAAFPEHGTIGQALIQTADKALYRAKAAGRNQVMAAGVAPKRLTP